MLGNYENGSIDSIFDISEKGVDDIWIVLIVNIVNLWSQNVFYVARMESLATGRKITGLKR